MREVIGGFEKQHFVKSVLNQRLVESHKNLRHIKRAYTDMHATLCYVIPFEDRGTRHCVGYSVIVVVRHTIYHIEHRHSAQTHWGNYYLTSRRHVCSNK